ncbi:MAG: amidohydrolase family protein [Thermoanaerobaculia bacterium]
MGRVHPLALGLLACAAVTATAAPARGEPLRYTVFLGTRAAGVVTYQPAPPMGESVLTLDINDRGRGPKLEVRVQADAAGMPRREHITGGDYWKNPVDERFELANGRAVWDSGAEKGRKRVTGPAFFYSRTGENLELALLATALLRSPGHRLPLLPDGEAHLETVGTARLALGAQARDLTLYAISGLATPTLYVWMERPDLFFGRYDGFVTAVPEGWEAAAPDLVKAQLEAVAQREKSIATRLSRRPAGPLAIRGARFFDPVTGAVTPGTTVVLSGNRVQAVGKDGETAVPAGAEVIDAKGRMLLPGLWDMHQHLTATDGILDLASGVTSGRDLGNDPDYLLAIKHRWSAGEGLGPRVVPAGVIDGPGPYASPTKVLVDTEEKARAAVVRYAELGYPQIKIYSSLDPKLVPPIAAEAHRLGLRVSGHIPNGLRVEEAVRDGFDEIQHVNFLMLNFLDPKIDTRTPARFTEVAAHAAEIDLASEPVRAFLRLLKERGTVIDPTLNAYEDKFTGRPGRIVPSLAPIEDRLPFLARRLFLGGASLPIPPGLETRYRDSFRACQAMVKAAYDAGITIVAGTDSLAGFTLPRELELYVEAGIPAPEVLRIATLGAAKVMKMDAELGTVAPGKLADLILVDGDPTVRMGDIRRVTLVIKDGVIYDPAQLSREVGMKPIARHAP